MAKDEQTKEPETLNNLIDRDEMLTLYRSELASVESAIQETERKYYQLQGKAEAVRALIAHHEKAT